MTKQWKNKQIKTKVNHLLIEAALCHHNNYMLSSLCLMFDPASNIEMEINNVNIKSIPTSLSPIAPRMLIKGNKMPTIHLCKQTL